MELMNAVSRMWRVPSTVSKASSSLRHNTYCQRRVLNFCENLVISHKGSPRVLAGMNASLLCYSELGGFCTPPSPDSVQTVSVCNKLLFCNARDINLPLKQNDLASAYIWSRGWFAFLGNPLTSSGLGSSRLKAPHRRGHGAPLRLLVA
jgi:hypothetical protein